MQPWQAQLREDLSFLPPWEKIPIYRELFALHKSGSDDMVCLDVIDEDHIDFSIMSQDDHYRYMMSGGTWAHQDLADILGLI